MKRIARQAVATAAVGSRLWPIVEAGTAVVLRYHRVAGSAAEPVPLAVTPEEFDAQLAFLKARCHVMGPRAIAEAIIEERPLPPGAVGITFDDGYEDNFSVAFPLLKKHDLAAAFFITAGWVETRRVLWWDRLHEYVREAAAEGIEPVGQESLPEPVAAAMASANLESPGGRSALVHELIVAIRSLGLPTAEVDSLAERVGAVLGADEPDPEPYLPMNWYQVQLLHEGGMTIGSHTMSHARLSTLPADDAYAELEQSRQLLEEKLGAPVDLLGYPAGDYNQDVVDLVAEAGYRAAYTTEPGPVRPGDNPLTLRRVGVWRGGYRGAASRFSSDVFSFQIGRLARRG